MGAGKTENKKTSKSFIERKHFRLKRLKHSGYGNMDV